jgi:hypothetical protein
MKNTPAPNPYAAELSPTACVHLQRGDADVRAVEIGGDVENEKYGSRRMLTLRIVARSSASVTR